MKSNIGIIISREFSERVSKKSFLITTILMPILMLGLMVAPALLMQFSSPSQSTIAVIDESGIVTPRLASDSVAMEFLTVRPTTAPIDSVIASEDYDGVLFIGSDIVDNPSNAALYMHEASSMEMELAVNSAIEDAVRDARLRAYNIENLPQILDEVDVSVNVSTLRINDDGDRESVSSMLSMMIGLFMTFVLYMFLLIYGQMVMTSIIEEKSNRVLELVVSSVKPVQLMMGKIIGVGLVAVVQVTIWAVLLCLMSAFLLPAVMPADVAAQVSMASAGSLDMATVDDAEMVQSLAMLTSVWFILKLMGFMLLFLIGGFLFYASMFAALGSAVDNIQDASQLTSFVTIPIILAIICSVSVGNDPNGALAFWTSMIPFTSPMVMLARIPFDIASWQIWLSLGILYVSFVFMAWFSGKIYRVGIFMYGKKPTIKDLYHWARYK